MPLFVNRVIVAGSLTRDPQVRFFANDKATCDFGLAINRKYRGGDGEMREDVVFIDISAWGRTAELCGQYLSKGRNVHIEGRLHLDQWEDKQGNKRSKIKIVADTVNFVGGDGNQKHDAKQNDTKQQEQSDTSGPANEYDAGLDEPPF